ncbi:MAG TPA: endonuclease, partial [Bacilli bacterium]|nr:endonuclease [Bacilli bacterium]
MNQTKSLISKVFALSALALSLAFVPISHAILTSPIEEATYAWTGAQTPSVTDSYYSQANGLTGSALKSKLYSFNKPTNTSYNWSRYEAADEAYNDSSSVISIYTRHNILKSAHVGSSYSWTTWNREHIYTQTAFPNSDEDNHNIFACEGQINGYRSNLKFGEVAHNSTNQVTVFGHITDNYKTASLWEPCDEAKGEVARAVLYTSLYYNYTISSIFSSEAVCLKWHAQFPVTEREIFRNNKVYTLQGNRNPFVDHPSYANSIYNPSTPYTEADPLGGTPVTAPNTITLSPSTPTIAVSQSVTLNVAVDTGSSSVNWTSSNNSVATVSNGVVTGVAAGTATITATSTLDTSVKGTATITVKSLSTLSLSG